MALTFTVTVCRIADDGNPPTNLEWYAAVTVHKKDGPLVVTGTGATPTDAMRAAFTGARDADARAAIAQMQAALR
ncbi:MAG: hypothetical protein ACRELB_10555 [Polyangiaceae bacterium]